MPPRKFSTESPWTVGTHPASGMARSRGPQSSLFLSQASCVPDVNESLADDARSEDCINPCTRVSVSVCSSSSCSPSHPPHAPAQLGCAPFPVSRRRWLRSRADHWCCTFKADVDGCSTWRGCPGNPLKGGFTVWACPWGSLLARLFRLAGGPSQCNGQADSSCRVRYGAFHLGVNVGWRPAEVALLRVVVLVNCRGTALFLVEGLQQLLTSGATLSTVHF